MDPMLRPLRPDDAEPVATLIRAAFAAQAVATDPPPSALRETGESVTALLAAGGGAVMHAAGAPIGAVLWQERDGGLYMGRLAVAPAWRGRGAARRLVAAAEAAARAQGLPRLHLSTRLVLKDNRRLFADCGFRETAQHAHPGYAMPTFVDMEKWLEPPGP